MSAGDVLLDCLPMWIFLGPGFGATASLLQPGLKERFLARLGKLVDVLLHAGLDPALAGRDLAAEARNVGFAGLQDNSCTRTHLLRHRTRCGQQQYGADSQDFLRQHDLSSFVFI
jgi:hypothetical protein